MDLNSYGNIKLTVTLVPAIVVTIACIIVWRRYPKSEELMLIIMKGIISRKNIDNRPTYLVCNRKLPSSKRRHFMYNSIFIITICVMCFSTVAIIEVTYECLHDPDLDCFKKKDDVKLSEFLIEYDESPINCSTISRGDFVICYRLTAFDPERAFIGTAAGYLLFKMLNFGLLIVAHVMLLVTQKLPETLVNRFKIGFALSILAVLFIPLLLRIFLDEVESAFRKMSYTVVLQFLCLAADLVHLVLLPWEKFSKSKEYYGDASLPDNADALENELEMA
ncbi:Hypothetical predicted protein [Paramuricea clavata]|uniref:Uncharacterized protein n=1 Tax=Paramuricea clavata TaxID=317549 RepID=A0A6S7HYH6_PARCT|nr:Hypothetical predicted protein [Paramuricea clavata]